MDGAVIWLFALALAQDGPERIHGGDRATKIEVLAHDFDKGLVAWRAETLGTHACAYAGMDDPKAGVILGLSSTGSIPDDHWIVYRTADSADDCYGHERSAGELNQAKARFAELGLNIEDKPAPASTGGFDLKTVKLIDESNPHSAEAVTRLKWEGELVWELRWTHDNPNGSSAKVSVDQVWIDGSRAFVTLVHEWSHEGGSGRTISGLVVDRPDE